MLLGVEEERDVNNPPLVASGKHRGADWSMGSWRLCDRDDLIAVSDLLVSFTTERTGVLRLNEKGVTFDHLRMQLMQKLCAQPLMDA